MHGHNHLKRVRAAFPFIRREGWTHGTGVGGIFSLTGMSPPTWMRLDPPEVIRKYSIFFWFYFGGVPNVKDAVKESLIYWHSVGTEPNGVVLSGGEIQSVVQQNH